MSIHVPSAALVRRLKAVHRACRYHHDLPRVRLDCLPVDLEDGAPVIDDKRLLVRVPVGIGATKNDTCAP